MDGSICLPIYEPNSFVVFDQIKTLSIFDDAGTSFQSLLFKHHYDNDPHRSDNDHRLAHFALIYAFIIQLATTFAFFLRHFIYQPGVVWLLHVMCDDSPVSKP